MSATLVDLSRFTTQEKLRLLEELWDDLCESPESLPVADWQKEELDRRKADAVANPGAGESWEVVRERLRNGKR